MFTKNIKFQNFSLQKKVKNFKNLNKKLKDLFQLKNNQLLLSLSDKYKYSFNHKQIKKYKKYSNFRLIGMGGSILGSEAIYQFLGHKIKKNFLFVNNLNPRTNKYYKGKILNIIISKSGNTLETISNTNNLITKKNNIFITEKKENYLNNLAKKLKAEIFEHNNFIGGRYSVLSEVGMLPAELMGLNIKKFKQINTLIKNKNFVNLLTSNVSNTLHFLKQKKFNSVILNYDEKSKNLFKWYQQLIAESLGKKAKGILPVISSMPKDNHSLMQLYLDGPKKSFYTFFHVFNRSSIKINKNKILYSHRYLKNKKLEQILYSQKKATEKIFLRKKIPFRSFEILKRDEKTLGELFCFFVLETILLGRSLGVDPFDQPSVELIKKETKKILLNN